MSLPIFDQAAQWVFLRNTGASTPVPMDELAISISTLHEMFRNRNTSVVLPDLFPGVALEAIFVPSDNGVPAEINSSTSVIAGQKRVTGSALIAIGNAIRNELITARREMMVYDYDGGAKAIVYLPEVRAAVLQAVNLTVLDA